MRCHKQAKFIIEHVQANLSPQKTDFNPVPLPLSPSLWDAEMMTAPSGSFPHIHTRPKSWAGVTISCSVAVFSVAFCLLQFGQAASSITNRGCSNFLQFKIYGGHGAQGKHLLQAHNSIQTLQTSLIFFWSTFLVRRLYRQVCASFLFCICFNC